MIINCGLIGIKVRIMFFTKESYLEVLYQEYLEFNVKDEDFDIKITMTF